MRQRTALRSMSNFDHPAPIREIVYPNAVYVLERHGLVAIDRSGLIDGHQPIASITDAGRAVVASEQ
jgi:hypothetical protein